MSNSIYQFTAEWPAHLSVGCVLLNERDEVVRWYSLQEVEVIEWAQQYLANHA